MYIIVKNQHMKNRSDKERKESDFFFPFVKKKDHSEIIAFVKKKT